MGQKAVFLALHVHNCSPGIVLRRAYVFSSLSLALSPFFLCSDTPDKGISDVFDQILLPREITHLAWSSNAMILLLQSKHKHGIHGEGTKMGDGFIRHLFSPPEVWVGSEMKQQWQLLGLSLCSLAALWRSWSVKKTHALSLFYNAALCFPFSIRTSTIF